MTNESQEITVKTKGIDIHKVIMYFLLLLNLGGEFMPDNLEEKINAIEKSFNAQIQLLDRRVFVLEQDDKFEKSK